MGLRRQYRKILKRISPEIYTRHIFKKRLGYSPNLEQPQTFNEKIQHRKLNSVDKRMSICADKYAVRDYVSNKVGAQYLIPLRGCFSFLTEEQIKSYNGNIVIKTTHDSGTVFIIRKDDKINHTSIINKINKSLGKNFGHRTFERWYSNIRPQIIIEDLLLTSEGKIPEDYKFHVFEQSTSEAKVILQVDFDRHHQHTRTFYDENLNILDFELAHPKNTINIRDSLKNHSEMFDIAKKLAHGFGYARVDLYNLNGKIYFGEITFAHGSGLENFTPLSKDYEWGSYWEFIDTTNKHV